MLVRTVSANSNWTPLGYEQITDLAEATALTVPEGARIAVVVSETSAVRWPDDDEDPTATVGMPLATGVYRVFDGDLSKVLFIQQAVNAKLNVAYYK